jgi:integrase/recombinase XerD
MRHLEIKTVKYRLLEQGFKDWLRTLGYAESTVYAMPLQLREFLHYLEQQGITKTEKLTAGLIKDFIQYFKNRKNQRRSGGLSIAHVNGQIDTINKFCKYLNKTGQLEAIIKAPYLKEENKPERTVLTLDEIKQLYKACEDSYIGLRDKAMLSVYYGCGLRKSEGLELETGDILFERRLLYIRKAKNNHERYVPMSEAVIKDLEAYIYEARPLLLSDGSKEDALFISERGRKLNPGSMVNRLQILKEQTANPALQQKSFGLHTLRHSIATHLLQKGLDIEQIALFLGHKTLDSTQIYTHIVNEL